MVDRATALGECRNRRVRLVYWVGALLAGMATALQIEAAPIRVAWLVPLPAAAAILLTRSDRAVWAQGIIACWIGLYAAARAREPDPLPAPLSAIVDTESLVSVRGWVLAAPEPITPREGSRLRVVIDRVNGAPARATVSLSVAAGVPDLLPGDTVAFKARLRSVRGLANPGLPDAALQARASGVDLFAGVGTSDSIRQVQGEVPFPQRGATALLRAATRARLALGRAIDSVVSGAIATFLHTAILGERRGTDALVEDGFRAAGATHVLSVSGLHLAAVGLVFFGGTRRVLMALPRLPLWIEPRATAALVAIPAVAFYTFVTGAAVATVRSAAMMVFALIGLAVGRRNTPLVAVAMAVLVLVGWSPLVLVDVSFQLSALSVLALALLVPRLRHATENVATPPGGSAMRALWPCIQPIWRWLGAFAAATGAAGVTTAPVVAHYFGEVTPAAPLGNLLLVPLVEAVIVPVGLLGAVVGATAGRTCSWPLLKLAALSARLALAVAEVFRSHAPVWLTRAPNVFETVTLTLGLACALAALRRPVVGRMILRCSASALLAAASASLCGREVARRWNKNLIVTFLDVGQGDAAVVQFPGGATMLIDGGGTYDGSFDPGTRVVEPFLRAHGITRLEAVALSHPHPDHLGGLHRVLARFPVERVWTSGDDGRNPDYLRFIAEARARGVSLPVPTSWDVNGVRVEPLGPFLTSARGRGPENGRRAEGIGVPEGTTVNDASLVLRAAFAGRSVLFTGDIEANGEGELVGRTTVGQTVASDVLKVPHHGSRTSSTDDLLDAIRPGLAVISLGWKNRFHFPRQEVVSRYQERRIRLLRTDLDGAITVTISPDGDFSATCARSCR